MAGEFDAGSVVAKFVADMSGFKAGMLQAKTQTSQMKTDLGNLAGVVTKTAAIFGVAFGAAGVVKFLGDSIKAFEESDRVMKQTEAVIRSTGGAAGYTSGEISKMAKGIQNSTAISDEAAQTGMNMLLTFTNIGHDIFPQVTQATIDMATAMNGGLTPSAEQLSQTAIQVGKAMQDPILGVTALRRVGVNFNETQTDMIKNLVETGKSMQAQQYILRELGKEFGGSAAAQLNTFGGRMEQLKNKFNDVQEVVGEILTPAIGFLADTFGSALGPAMQYISQNSTTLKMFVIGLAGAFMYLGQIVVGVATTIGYALSGSFGKARDSFYTMIGNLQTTFSSTEQKMTDVVRTQTDKQVGIAGKGFQQEAQASSKKSQQVKKDLEDETRKYEEENAKRKKDFDEQLADLIRAHLDKKAELEKEIKDENESFADDMKTRTEDFAEKMSDMKTTHQDKVDSIKEQIDEETAKGVDADQARLTSLQKSLDEENTKYDAQKLKAETDEAEATAKLQKEHDKRVTDYQTSLNAENDILKLHQSDVDAVKDKAREDDITRLKRQFTEENDASTKEHVRRLAEIADRGSALGDTLGGNMAAGLGAHGDQIKGIGSDMAKGFGDNLVSGVSDSARKAGEKAVTDMVNGIKDKASQLMNWVAGKGGFGPAGQLFEGLKWVADNLKNLPGFAQGGIVPGQLGAPMLAQVHGGEIITPPGGVGSSRMASGVQINVSLDGAMISDEAGAKRIAEVVGDNIVRVLQQNVRF